MRPMLTRSTQAAVCVAALVTLAACSGDADGEKTSNSASSSNTSSEPTYDDEYAYKRAKAIAPKPLEHDLNKPLPEDTPWATASYIKVYNDQLAALQKQGVVYKGSVKIDALHEASSEPDAPGGWDLTAYQCSTSTARLYKDGKDVTAQPGDPTKPAPKGPRKGVHLLSFTSPDQGETWQLDKAQLLTGKDAADSPCDE